MTKRKDGEGSVRQLPDGSWECLMQSKYINENADRNESKERLQRSRRQSSLADWH